MKSVIFCGSQVCRKAALVFREDASSPHSHTQFPYKCPSAEADLIHVDADWDRQEALHRAPAAQCVEEQECKQR